VHPLLNAHGCPAARLICRNRSATRIFGKECSKHRAILIPPSWEGDNSEYSLEAAAKYPDLFAVMGRIPIDKPEGRVMVETWKDQPGMLGVRLTFHHAWDQDWIKNGVADWFWPAAERLNIPVMMNAPTVLPEVAQVAARHPNLRIIIDHMGRLRGMKDETLRLDKTIALAKYPNVHVKLTLISECTSAEYPYKNIQPEVRKHHRCILAAPVVLGYRSFGDVEPVHLHLWAGRYALHGRDRIFKGRPGMDHGKRTGCVPALAGQVMPIK